MKMPNYSVLRSLSVVVLLSISCWLVTGCGEKEKTSVELLKEHGYGPTVLDYLLAVDAADLTAVRLFHEMGMAPDEADESGTTALMRAAAGGKVELVDILLKGGANLKAANGAGRTPLMFAAEKGEDAVLRGLLAKGADVNAVDREGWSALKLAAYHSWAEATDTLAGRVEQEQLDEALLTAGAIGDPKVLGILLAQGAYVNTRNPENLTPLMIAAQNGHLDAVKVLLRNQANPFALDDSEHTAANLAETAGHMELRDLLLDPSAIFEIAEAEAAKEMAKTPGLSAVAQEDAEQAIVKTLGALVGDKPMVTGSESAQKISGPAIAGTPTTGGVPAAFQNFGSGSGVTLASANSGPRVAPIAGQTLPRASSEGTPGGVSVVESLKLKSYREAPLPVMLKSVEAGAGTAMVRILSRADSTPVEVREGEMIPGTTLRVASMDTKHISSKLGNGHLVDVSRILVEDTRTGSKHLLIKNVPGRSNQTYATLTLPGSPNEYVVKNGDTFRAVAADNLEHDYEVLDVRPTQVVIRNVSTDEVLTVNREGLAMR